MSSSSIPLNEKQAAGLGHRERPQQQGVHDAEDNGVGRAASQKLRQQNFPLHKSKGTVLTEERLKVINLEEKASYEVIDLFDGKKSTGTLVRIWVAM